MNTDNTCTYHDNQLYIEDTALSTVVARWKTPCYVYSKAALKNNWSTFYQALMARRPGSLVCYAVKANSNLAILQQLAEWGAGFDIVSGGELARVLAAGGRVDQVVFSGVGKTVDDISAALRVGIHCFNVESVGELERIERVASHMDCQAPVSLRINPDIAPDTHPHIVTGSKDSKFGIPYADALSAYRVAVRMPHLRVLGIDCHIGSQINQCQPFVLAARALLALMAQLREEGIELSHINLGGGLGVDYEHRQPTDVQGYIDALCRVLETDNNHQRWRLILEPGRFIVANTGILLTTVLDVKSTSAKHFIVVDAAMNDLLRPVLYQARHAIQPLKEPQHGQEILKKRYDVVGPICESGDFLAKDRPLSVQPGDVLAFMDVGAYGFCMSSQYNSRPRACEIMIDGDRAHAIRRRETLEDLFAAERLLS